MVVCGVCKFWGVEFWFLMIFSEDSANLLLSTTRDNRELPSTLAFMTSKGEDHSSHLFHTAFNVSADDVVSSRPLGPLREERRNVAMHSEVQRDPPDEPSIFLGFKVDRLT